MARRGRSAYAFSSAMVTFLWLLVISFNNFRDVIATSGCEGPITESFEFRQPCAANSVKVSYYMEWHASRSELDCARMCGSSKSCLSFNYIHSLGPSHPATCGLDDSRLLSCASLVSFENGTHFEKTSPSCASPWRIALAHSVDNVHMGSLSDLISMVEQGAQVRILIAMADKETLYEANTVWVKGDAVSAAILLMLPESSSSGYTYWTRIFVNTSGYTNEVGYYGPSPEDEQTQSVLWYVKETASKCHTIPATSPIVLELGVMGEIRQGSVGELMAAMNAGYPVQIVAEMGPIGYKRSLTVDWAYSDSGGSVELAASLLSESSEPLYQTYFTTETMVVRLPNYTVVSYTNQDIFNASRRVNRVAYPPPLLFAVDYCWEKVYATTVDGYAESGSYEKLANRIAAGHRIRVAYQCQGTSSVITLRIDKVTESVGEVTAYAFISFNHPVPDSNSYNWTRAEVNSWGQVARYTLERPGGREYENYCYAAVSWFADTVSRKPVWSYHADAIDNNSGNFLAPEYMVQGLMPQVVMTRTLSPGRVESFPLQAFTVAVDVNNQSRMIVYGVNARSFNESQVTVHSFDSNHSMWEILIASLDKLGDSYHYLTLSILWYV